MLKSGDKTSEVMGGKSAAIWAYVFAGILLVAAVIFLIRPSLMGYNIYQEVAKTNYSLEQYGESVQNLKGNLAVAKTNSSIYAEQYAIVRDTNDKLSFRLQSCSESRAVLDIQLNSTITENTASAARLKDEIGILSEKLKSLESEKKTVVLQMGTERETVVAQMTSEREAVIAQMNEVCDLKITNTANDLEKLQADYDALVISTARSVCCKARIDDASIDSFDVLNHRVVCINGGEKKIVC